MHSLGLFWIVPISVILNLYTHSPNRIAYNPAITLLVLQSLGLYSIVAPSPERFFVWGYKSDLTETFKNVKLYLSRVKFNTSLLFLSEPTILVGSDFFVLIFSSHCLMLVYVLQSLDILQRPLTLARPNKEARFTGLCVRSLLWLYNTIVFSSCQSFFVKIF